MAPASKPLAPKPPATKPAAGPVTPSVAAPHQKAKETKPSPHPSAPSHDEHDAHPGQGKSSSRYVQHDSDVIVGPDKLGASRSLKAGAMQSHGHGVETSQSVDFGGKIVTNVAEVPDTSPPQYRVTLTIDLSAGGSVGASRDDSGGVGGCLSASASGSLTLSVSHEMAADAKDQYLKRVKTGGGGASEELRVAQLVARGSLDEAKSYLQGRKSIRGSADAAGRTWRRAMVALGGRQGRGRYRRCPDRRPAAGPRAEFRSGCPDAARTRARRRVGTAKC